MNEVHISHIITHTNTYIFHCRNLAFKKTFDKMWQCNFSPWQKLNWHIPVSHCCDYNDLLNVRLWSDIYSCVVWYIQLCGLVYTAMWSGIYSCAVWYIQLCGLVYIAMWYGIYSCVVWYTQLCGLVYTAVWSCTYSCVDLYIQLFSLVYTAVQSGIYSRVV
jgi:hypothetical protein